MPITRVALVAAAAAAAQNCSRVVRVCCWAGHSVYHFARRKSSLEAERAETVRAQLAAARDVVSDFQAPFATVKGDVFCGLGELARVAAVEDATATDGVLPARGLGGDRRRRGLTNGVFGGVISNYETS